MGSKKGLSYNERPGAVRGVEVWGFIFYSYIKYHRRVLCTPYKQDIWGEEGKKKHPNPSDAIASIIPVLFVYISFTFGVQKRDNNYFSIPAT